MNTDLISSVLSVIGLSSPILIAIGALLTIIARSYLDKKFEIYRDSSIEKIRHENLALSTELQHRLSIGFDKVKIIHENQKEALGKVFAILSDAVSECQAAYFRENHSHRLFPKERYKEIQKEVHANGLFVDGGAFQIVSLILNVLGRNTDWIYEMAGRDESYQFSEFDLSLLDCLLGLLFVSFRHQIGIEEIEIEVSTINEWTRIAELSSFPIQWTLFGLSALFSGDADVEKTREVVFENERTRNLVISALRSTIRGASDIPRVRREMEHTMKYLEEIDEESKK